MKQAAMTFLVVLTAMSLPAVEVRLLDGSVVEALGYTVTGSYVLLEMPDGGRVAYDVADVDLDALLAANSTGEPDTEHDRDGGTLGVSGALTLGDDSTSTGPVITDRDVGHVRPGAAEDTESEGESSAADTDSKTTDGVELDRLLTVPLDVGRYRITAEVVNRTPQMVQAVRARISVALPDRDPWVDQVSVAPALAAGEKVELSKVVSLPPVSDENWRPSFQVNLLWISSERVPNPGD